MTAALSLAAWIITAPLAVLFMILLLELALGAWPSRTKASAQLSPSAQIVILIPAHNEAGGIEQMLRCLLPLLNAGQRALVVADNCSDDTASRARACGAQVIERHDPLHRGKGHALSFGRDFLCNDPPDCIIVLDADCIVEQDTITRLAACALETGSPVQGSYLLRSESEAKPMVQISNFALLIKNLVRQRGAGRLGAPAVLGGTGMAFPWRLIATAPLASSHLVEDLELGIALARAGHPPRFLEAARIWSAPAGEKDTLTQRTRWEHGYIRIAMHNALPLIWEGLTRGSLRLAWLGCHILVPPLALLLMCGAMALACAVLLALPGADQRPAMWLGGVMLAATVMLATAWATTGRSTIQAGTLLRIPLYIFWKIPVYLGLLRKRQVEWVRTPRNGD